MEFRLSELKKVSLDDTDTEPNEEEDSDFSLTDFLTSLVGEAAEETQEEDTDSGFPVLIGFFLYFLNVEDQLKTSWM